MYGKTILILLIVAVAFSVGLIALTPHEAAREIRPYEGQEPQLAAPTADDIGQHVAGDNALALELYHVLEEREGNLLFSPYSISASLGMTYCGARGETFKEMRDVLHFSLAPALFSRAVAELGEMLNQENGLYVANSLWTQQSLPFNRSFVMLLHQGYGVEPETVDFVASPENVRRQINTWAAEQTAGKIEHLIPVGGVDSTTRLVLASAIYFKNPWKQPFQTLPQPREFHLLNGRTVRTPMMSVNASLAWVREDTFQAVCLPYEGDTSMLLLLPDLGTFQEFQASLTPEKLNTILASLDEQTLFLTMPKFECASDFQLREALEELGMEIPFSSAANFSGMTKAPLRIAQVFHKAYVHVDEQGTEAGAATAITMARGLTNTPSVNIDRPFIFLIRHDPTGTILFMGRVLNPAEET